VWRRIRLPFAPGVEVEFADRRRALEQVDELEKRGLNVEDFMLRLLSKELNLDPEIVAEARLELAEKYFAEGKELVDKDPVQAGEKLYKVAEECVKALAIHYNLEDILRNVEKRGGWTVTDLEKAVKEIS
jgi:hypothetical protein